MTQDPLEFLEHYGVKGMRWGVRNDIPASRSSHDYKSTKHLRNRRTHELTNKQLKTINERINLEQNYNRLNPTKVKKGHAAVKGFLTALATGVTLYNLLNSPAGKMATAAGRELLLKGKILRTIA